jgi:thymidylate synthase (FAD)
MHSAKLVAISQSDTVNMKTQLTAEEFIIYCARVSNPENQDNHMTAAQLLQSLVRRQHWSPLEMASAVMEITTTRDIGRQILRHRSYSFQELRACYVIRHNS